ncbi:MAG: membrane protein insertase YidC [Bacteroidetes bacterium HGW-Bacteroidetes-10]|nr:MAG: membrane protein insertase YidC [Bacteroidetes bacterium HGW-Bacteroidetes-10]
MNKNSILGFVLIGVILIAFSWYNSKIINETKAVQQAADSVAAASVAISKTDSATFNTDSLQSGADSIVPAAVQQASPYKDSLLIKASLGAEEFSVLENDKIKVELTNLGAQPSNVLIKEFKAADSSALVLMKSKSSKLSLSIYTNEEIRTDRFAFTKYAQTDTSVTYRLFVDSTSYIQYEYVLSAGSYMLSANVTLSGMERHIPRNVTSLDLSWVMDMPRLEKGYDNEKNYSTIVYKYPNDKSVDDLGLRKDDAEEDIRTKVEWIAYQQQFFSAILVAENSFANANMRYRFYPEGDPDGNLMRCESLMQVPYNEGTEVTIPFSMYFGPNHFKTLKSYDKGFEKIVPLGGWLIGWINRYIIITVFDFLGRFISNYGIIILILTILIKLVISPLTFKSYMSSAKMRVLKPEIDKINAKYPKTEDAMKKQQETMALYSKTGVSMFGGCLPMLLQFPILFAMFRFFPSSFELRQEGFLWAHDLSTYDSILTLPFTIPLFGDHLSLFALLMAVSTYFYSRMNIDQMTSGPQMAGMKVMSLYFMPIFLLFLGNNFSSGLSYYYLLSNLITMVQTWAIRRFFVDEEKIYAKLKERAAAPKKKSKFQERLDSVYKTQQEQLKKRK